jgi:hypothetical protein
MPEAVQTLCFILRRLRHYVGFEAHRIGGAIFEASSPEVVRQVLLRRCPKLFKQGRAAALQRVEVR